MGIFGCKRIASGDMMMRMDEDDYRRRWACSIPSEFSASRHRARGKLVATTSVTLAELERFKALAASQDRSAGALLGVLISTLLDGGRAADSFAESEPIKGRRATVSTQIGADDHGRLVAISRRGWVSMGSVLRQLIREALEAEDYAPRV